MIKIDKDVPVPGKNSFRKSIYPFDIMEIGDSFLVELKDGEVLRRVISRVSSVAGLAAKRSGGGVKFTARQTADGIRVWRIA